MTRTVLYTRYDFHFVKWQVNTLRIGPSIGFGSTVCPGRRDRRSRNHGPSNFNKLWSSGGRPRMFVRVFPFLDKKREVYKRHATCCSTEPQAKQSVVELGAVLISPIMHAMARGLGNLTANKATPQDRLKLDQGHARGSSTSYCAPKQARQQYIPQVPRPHSSTRWLLV